jgi:hypothetical protein
MACLELMLKCLSVNGIIWLMGSVCLGPKVIPLSGAYCIMLLLFFLYITFLRYSRHRLMGSLWEDQLNDANKGMSFNLNYVQIRRLVRVNLDKFDSNNRLIHDPITHCTGITNLQEIFWNLYFMHSINDFGTILCFPF